jgi:7-keto-8-aminopelargonate synthetase-like enzyme
LVDFLVNRARPFIFSTAPVPAAAAAVTQAICLVQSAEGLELRRKLLSNIADFHSAWGKGQSLTSESSFSNPSRVETTPPNGGRGANRPIIPIILGDEAQALDAAAKLREQGIFVPAIRYPSVARGAARLRVTLTAAHSREDIFCLVDSLKKLDIGI